MDVLLIALLTLLNGVFAMSEMALASSRKARLMALAEGGDAGAQAALRLMDQPTRFLSTVQVGITSIGVLNGIVGEAAFSAGLAQWLGSFGIGPRPAGIAATAIVVAVITFITIIFGELVPKRIGQLYPEPVARLIARPMVGLAQVAGPFVRLLSACTQGVLKLLRIDTGKERTITEEELTHSLEEGVDAGVIDHHERQMVQNVFHLDDRTLTSMMLPRSEIEWLDASLSVGQALARSGSAGAHSWYPVCRGSLDDVVGVVSIARLLALGPQAGEALEALAVPAVFLPETLTGLELLDQFRAQSARMVFVVDEYGEIVSVSQKLLAELRLQSGELFVDFTQACALLFRKMGTGLNEVLVVLLEQPCILVSKVEALAIFVETINAREQRWVEVNRVGVDRELRGNLGLDGGADRDDGGIL